MRLVWSVYALADREAIFDYIAEYNPSAAVEIDLKFSSMAERLLEFPHSGRTGRVDDTRELVVNGTPYIVIYHLGNDALRILRVLHGAQQWPD